MTDPYSWLYSGPARLVSFLGAAGLSGLILVYPAFVTGIDNQVNHGMLSLLLWGIAAGFVHGIGFKPVNGFWKTSLGPVSAWSIMLLTCVYYLS